MGARPILHASMAAWRRRAAVTTLAWGGGTGGMAGGMHSIPHLQLCHFLSAFTVVPVPQLLDEVRGAAPKRGHQKRQQRRHVHRAHRGGSGLQAHRHTQATATTTQFTPFLTPPPHIDRPVGQCPRGATGGRGHRGKPVRCDTDTRVHTTAATTTRRVPSPAHRAAARGAARRGGWRRGSCECGSVCVGAWVCVRVGGWGGGAGTGTHQ